MSMKYPVSKPSVTELEKKYVNEALDSGWISSQGEHVKRFENAFSSWNGINYGVACSSGTTALILALRACQIGEGDEVIVPEFTMIATAWAVSFVGAKPVFVDCGDDLNIDVSLIEEKITPNTKAIIHVHVYGRRANMEKINELAYEYNLRVIEDSAEAHGVKPTGDIACFSLFANKIISSGEGGICLTNDPKLADQMKHLRAMAFDPNHTFLHKKFGYNFRMSNLQAAFALGQVERLDEILAKRKQIEEWYDKYIPEELKMPPRDVLWYYDIAVGDYRDELAEELKVAGVETRPFFRPMSEQPMYFNENYKKTVAYAYSRSGLYLPTYTDMTEDEVKEICELVKSVL